MEGGIYMSISKYLLKFGPLQGQEAIIDGYKKEVEYDGTEHNFWFVPDELRYIEFESEEAYLEYIGKEED